MLRPNELQAGDVLTVEFMNAHAKTEEVEPSEYDWVVDAVEIEMTEPDEDEDEEEFEPEPVEAIVDISWAGGDDDSDTAKRLRFDHMESGRWKIEREQSDGTWFRWNKKDNCNVRYADDE